MGNCVDGVMARGIAEHLETNPLLVMVDAWAPGSERQLNAVQARLRRWITRAKRWSQYGRMKARGDLSWLEFLARFRLLSAPLIALGKIEPPSEAEEREKKNNVALYDAYSDVRFSPYAVKRCCSARAPNNATRALDSLDGPVCWPTTRPF